MKLIPLTTIACFSVFLVACNQGETRSSVEQNSNPVIDKGKDITLNQPEAEDTQSIITVKKAEKEIPIRNRKEHKANQLFRMDSISKSMPVTVQGMIAEHMPSIRHPIPVTPQQRDNFAKIESNSVKLVSEEPVSTFSIDVDTGSYAVVRRFLNDGMLPPSDAVRIEELVNYFDYQYKAPQNKKIPFAIKTEITKTPWNENTHLVQIGLQGYLPENEQRSNANLVFLVDVSGSMNANNKLPLLKNAFRLLTRQLTEDDTITMVVYAGSSGVVLEPTTGEKKGTILAALDKLSAGGSTHGSAGIKLAYSMAQQSFKKGAINRVILATDGDFNVGTVNHEALIDLIKQKKSEGISLTTLGFGSGNYNDHLMEQLADSGDGNYAYIDNLSEARKTLVSQISSTLETIAKDVKIQIEWNPEQVSEYRLIGYENRLLNREDFNNDKIDAGEIGAGHTVTALYEISLTKSKNQRIDPLRYRHEEPADKRNRKGSQELAFVKVRFKQPQSDVSEKIQYALNKNLIKNNISKASHNLRFAAAVAAYGDLLRGGEHVDSFSYEDVLKLARDSRGNDKHGYRGEFLRLVELAESLSDRG